MRTSPSLDDHLRQMVQEAVNQAVAPLQAEIHTLAQALKEGQTQGPYMTVNEAAQAARCHPQTIRHHIRKGALQAKRLGVRVLISRVDLDNFLSDRP